MTTSRLRVEISVDPLLLGSAIHASLSCDSRLDVVLASSARDDTDPGATVGAEPAVHSGGVPLARITAVTQDPPSIRLLVDGGHRSIPYQGMGPLADALVQELHGWTNPAVQTLEEQHA